MNPLSKHKAGVLLISLVAVIYTLRHSEVSLTSPLTFGLRALFDSNDRLSAQLCPGIDINDPISSSQRSQGQTAIETVRSLRGTNRLLTYITSDRTNDDTKDYGLSFIGVVVPWVVMLILSIICCLSICCSWCCIHGCCKNCKICSCCKAPRHQTKRGLYVGMSVFFLLGIIGTGVAGLIISTQIPSNIETTMCTTASVMEDLKYGVPADKWMGLDRTITSLKSVLDKFDDAVSKMNSVSGNIQTASNKLNALDNQLDTVYTKYTSTIAGNAARAPAPHTTYKPDYVTKFGPKTDNTTASGVMKVEFDTNLNLLKNASQLIDNGVTTIKNAQSSIKEAVNQGIGTSGQVSDQINDVLNKINDNQNTIHQATKGVKIGLIVLFAVNLGLGVFSIAAMIFLVGCRVKVLSKCLHLGWCLFILLTLISWIIGGIFYPVSLAVLEGCDVAYASLGNKDTFHSIVNAATKGGNSASDVVDVCMFGDGSMLTKLGLTSYLKNFDIIYAQFDKVQEKYPTTAAPASVTIPIQQTLASNFYNGLAPDTDQTVTDLRTLNVAVNKNLGSCATVQDTWVLNSASCSSVTGAKVFASSDSSTSNVGNPTCIGFDQWVTPTRSSSDRYTAAMFASCTPTLATAIDFADGFTNYNVPAVKKVFDTVTGMQSDLNSISTNYNSYASSLSDVLKDFDSVKTGISGIKDSLVGEANGLVPNSNCTFIKTDSYRMANTICYALTPSVYYTSIVIIVMACMSLLSTLCVFLLLKRVNLPVYEPAKMMSPSL